MRARFFPGRFEILLLVIAISVANICSSAWAQHEEGIPSVVSQFQSDSPPALVDFDGDRVGDPLTLDRRGGQPSIEIHLSRAHEVSTLPVDSSQSTAGRLTVRDLDGDGDLDLFWKEETRLALPEIIVWLKDGTGRFTREFLPHPQQSPQPTPGRSLRGCAYSRWSNSHGEVFLAFRSIFFR